MVRAIGPVNRPLSSKIEKAAGTSSTTSVSGSATQGRIHPSVFSSALRPGHSMVCRTSPARRRHRQVRQVPLRHELGSSMPAASNACSKVVDAPTATRAPSGMTVTV